MCDQHRRGERSSGLLLCNLCVVAFRKPGVDQVILPADHAQLQQLAPEHVFQFGGTARSILTFPRFLIDRQVFRGRDSILPTLLSLRVTVALPSIESAANAIDKLPAHVRKLVDRQAGDLHTSVSVAQAGPFPSAPLTQIAYLPF